MNIFKKKSEAYKFTLDDVVNEKIKDVDLADRLQMTCQKFYKWLEREYPGKTEWDQTSLNAAIEHWRFGSWDEYSDYLGYPKGTVRRYAIEGQDYKKFRKCILACQSSADQFKHELDKGLRGNRPKKYTEQGG
jgi:hypothetical protein